jgi:ribosomal peptide maturation radical SAM protein 1
MPFVSLERPSIQLGLLKAIGARAGHRVETLHAALDLVRCLRDVPEVGERAIMVYERLAAHRYAVGDWLFAADAFGPEAPTVPLDPELVGSLLSEDPDSTVDDTPLLARLRADVVPAYLDRLVESVDWRRYEVVGFTSTFQQNVASFALAQRLKAAHPGLRVLFGGANFDADMGRAWMEAMPFVDLAVRGEADLAFPQLLDVIAAGGDPAGVPGVLVRRGRDVVGTAPAAPVEHLDESPLPDYHEFFERTDALGLKDEIASLVPLIPFESARGCWWGQVRHCTFCGLNGQTMRYRSKSPARVADELIALAIEYRNLRLEAVDNILDRGYLAKLLPAIAEAKLPLQLFYETKADLTREDLALFASAGLKQIQPGIESLDSHTLALMRKGTRAAWNVNVLRWARVSEVHVAWNILWGFPGERPEDVVTQTAVLRHLWHLQPPLGGSRVWMERFSPMFRERERFPIRWIRPHASYGAVYPARVDLSAAAYFFDYELEGALPDDAYRDLDREIERWRAAIIDAPDDGKPDLRVVDDGGRLLITDRRHRAEPADIALEGPEAAVHRACMDAPRTVGQMAEALGIAEALVEEIAADLADRGLLFPDRRLYVALALPAD